jgi:hypothetical protein
MAWEPGDDICPPWPWPWPGPRPPWWDERLTEVGLQVFVGLSLVSTAGKVADREMGLQVARVGAELINKHASELSGALEQVGA